MWLHHTLISAVFLSAMASMTAATPAGQPPPKSNPDRQAEPKQTPAESKTTLARQLQMTLDQGDVAKAGQVARHWLKLRRRRYAKHPLPNENDGPVNDLTDDLVKAFRQHALAYRKRGEHAKTIEAYRQAIGILQELPGGQPRLPTHDYQLAVLLNCTGVELFLHCQYAAAEDLQSQAVACYERSMEHFEGPASHEQLAQIYDNLSASQERQEKYEVAAHTLSRALAIRKQLYSADKYPLGHPKLARVLHQRGRVLFKAGRRDEAVASLEKAVRMFRGLAATHDDARDQFNLATALTQLGLLHLQMGKAADARKCLEQSLALQPDSDSDDVLTQLNRGTVLDALLTIAVTEGDLVGIAECRGAIERIVKRVLATDPPPFRTKGLVILLNHLAVACEEYDQYERAEQYYLQCFDIWRRMCRRDPRVGTADPTLVNTLSGIAVLYLHTGQEKKAYAPQAEALRMAQSLYPNDRYPAGHRLIVISSINLGCLLWETGEVEPALKYFRDSVRMSRRLWPKTEFPNGNPTLLASIRAYADALLEVERYDDANRYYEEARQIAARLYPQSAFPNGHIEWEQSARDLGKVELARGHYAAARNHYFEAMAGRRRRLESAADTNDNMLALMLDRIGQTYRDEGDYQHAEQFCIASLNCRRALFPADAYPHGHRYIDKGLRSLAELYFDATRYREAYDLARQATGMECESAEQFAQSASEAQILNYVAKRLKATDLLMSSWQQTDLPPSDVYAIIWRRRGLATRLITALHQRMRNTKTVTTSETYRDYLDARRGLAAALGMSSGAEVRDMTGRLARIQSLNERKEKLERALADRLPAPPPGTADGASTVQSLAHELPDTAVFVDFIRYDLHTQDPRRPGATGHRSRTHYGAFRVRAGDRPRFVDLGETEEIDAEIATWRNNLLAGRSGVAESTLYRRVWTPIQQLFPNDTRTVYIRPDGQLSLMPWSALAAKPGAAVLLEHYAIATVPSGHFLLKQLRARQPHPALTDNILAVGNVDYGQVGPGDTTDAVSGWRRIQWPPLPETGPELDTLLSCSKARNVTLLTGKRATVPRVLESLTHATTAHLATHGFYLDSPLQAELAIADGNRTVAETNTATSSRRSVLERNPFLLSGLALAGANDPPLHSTEFDTAPLPGIVTAQDIVALDCRGLQLVVLSGCKTSLGSHADGSPVGLQAAFHVAGARNVIASLWDVDDRATRRLMQSFYSELARHDVGPLAALRRAQLVMMRSSASQDRPNRGPILTHTVRLKSTKIPDTRSTAQWAAWSLSGPGF